VTEEASRTPAAVRAWLARRRAATWWRTISA